MFLARTSSKVIRYLNKHSNSENCVPYNTLLNNIKCSHDELNQALNDLNERNLIIITGYTINSYGKNATYDNGLEYYSSIFGKDYYRLQLLDWLKSCMNGIVFPIIVSLITNFLIKLLSL